MNIPKKFLSLLVLSAIFSSYTCFAARSSGEPKKSKKWYATEAGFDAETETFDKNMAAEVEHQKKYGKRKAAKNLQKKISGTRCLQNLSLMPKQKRLTKSCRHKLQSKKNLSQANVERFSALNRKRKRNLTSSSMGTFVWMRLPTPVKTSTTGKVLITPIRNHQNWIHRAVI